MQYRREIDGLRAVAVAPVIMFHAGIAPFSGGYVGVDVFFVISGYLITSILIDDLARGRFSILRFYERRARRILPALFAVMLFCIPFALLWMLPSELRDFSRSLVAVTLFVSNILFWREDDYFATASEEKPLLHTWSLAVEEQYYLFFPIFLFLLWRFGRQRTFWAIVAVAGISLALAQWGAWTNPRANFFLAPTRAWELFAGAICAFVLQDAGPRRHEAGALAGLALIALAVFGFGAETPMPSLWALIPVVGTALVILFAAQGTLAARLLSTGPMVGIGLISYSAYLWHQPIFAFARMRSIEPPGAGAMLALSLAALLAGYLSWRFIEQPFRHGPRPVLPRRAQVFGVSAAAGAVFLALGITGEVTGTGDEVLRESYGEKCNFNRNACHYHPEAALQVALWGDSFADAFAESLGREIEAAGGSLSLAIRHSCASVLGVRSNEDLRRGPGDAARCLRHNRDTWSQIEAGGFDAVVLSAHYVKYASYANLEGAPVLVEPGAPDKAQIDILADNLAKTAAAIRETGAQVIVVTPHAQIRDFAPRMKEVRFEGRTQIEADPTVSTAVRGAMIAALDATGISYVEVAGMDWFCDARGHCPTITDAGEVLLYDGQHISTRLSPRAAHEVMEAIAAQTRSNLAALH